MRRLAPRPPLPDKVAGRLEKETLKIEQAADPKREAADRYRKARRARWFKPIVKALQDMSGSGERCMFCSSSESSQVEHFRPKAVFPKLAMTWDNFLWSCGLCNQSKGNRFPPDTEPGANLINPIVENVWDFFFIDEFGNLTPRWRNDLDDLEPRAVSTRNILALDRQALQESRQRRLLDLKRQVTDSIELFTLGRIDRNALYSRYLDWLIQPFQPDVADYFLSGPGRSESPFADYFGLL